jgi:putative nucleotidyltransferase with HDIG domain
MTEITKEIIRESEDFVFNYMAKPSEVELIYHTKDHILFVRESALKIASELGYSEEDKKILEVAALFHDIGYVDNPKNHEEKSCEIAKEFLSEKGFDGKTIEIINQAIMATKIPQNPQNEISKVLCDADLLHLSSENYVEQADKMRREKCGMDHMKLSKKDFDKMSVQFYLMHNYHTKYGKEVLEPLKKENLKKMVENIKKKEAKPSKEEAKLKKEIEKLQAKLDKGKVYSKGVETMFRTTSRNQISLSSIADNKSNILISVNTIIISIVLTVLVSRFAEYPNLIIPSLVFLISSLVTIIFAILSTRPNINSVKFSKDDIKQKKVNLLFFGNFYNMKVNDYVESVEEMMDDDDYLYKTMVKDQYYLGKVLAKKYKLLRTAYSVFMFGLILTVIVYVLSFLNV